MHIDYAGPVDNHMILIIQDYYSKWIEASPMKHSTFFVSTVKFNELFARFD